MFSVSRLAERYIIEQLFSDGLPFGAPAKSPVSSITIAGIFACLGAGLFIYGSYLYFDRMFTQDAAFLLSGLVAMTFGILIAGLHFLYLKMKFAKINQAKEAIAENISGIIHEIEDEFVDFIEENKTATMAAAAVAGVAVGQKFL